MTDAMGWTRPATSREGAPTPDVTDLTELLAVLPEAHLLVASDATVVATNQLAAALAGRAPTALVGAALAALVADEPAKVDRFLSMCARSRHMVPGGLTIRTADGDTVPLRCDGAVVRASTSAEPALLLLRIRPRESAASQFVALTERIDALNREIARREAAERELRQQAELLEQVHDAILVRQPGVGVTYLNRAAVDLYGWPRADLLGQRIHDLVRSRAALPLAEIHDIVQETGEWRGELVQTTRSGQELLVDSRMVLLRANDSAPLVLETVRDVTKSRRAQAQLEAAQRMEAVGRLAGGAAHEINNALQGTIGFAALGLGRLPAGDPARRDLELAIRSGERAASVTQRLLAFSRRQITQPANVDLGEIAQKFAPMMRQALGPVRDLLLELPSAPAVVHADQGQLEQILLNFVLNARDATGVGGRVIVSISSVVLTSVDVGRLHPADIVPGCFVRLDVADTGHGMSPATLARMFEPFFTTKAPGQGTGLGLSVVHGIVHQNGGAIAARSDPGRGTTLSVYLPEVVAAKSRIVDGTAPAASGGAERILVVDDEPLVLEFASRALGDAGYSVETATDGGEALQQLEVLGTDQPPGQCPIDLVVSDLVMPVVGGRELGIALAQRFPGLPVIYTSGHPGEEIVPSGQPADAARVIQKPFSREQLLESVRAALDRAQRH